ncbi:aspartyl-phosphate phosphatase Spo0E family protein [Paenibacillus piri]|uniref:Aspartyl-phosphate phosphatase Spo0E family protein n=1 Tax=Paenibacillus piri TaxID=2547395 RepID=A0A4R5KSW1_9BACL|nr:aspartyl-phosphate phosphatase Spo0E family protein [Paenibacillus piri]
MTVPPNSNLSRSELSAEIEKVRTHMVHLAGEFGFLHPEVQHCSKQLDSLLIQYYLIDRVDRTGE